VALGCAKFYMLAGWITGTTKGIADGPTPSTGIADVVAEAASTAQALADARLDSGGAA
jgi:hypothetical protein